MTGIIFFSFQYDWLVFCLILPPDTQEENFDPAYLCLPVFCACLTHHDTVIRPKFQTNLFCIWFFRGLLSRKSDSQGTNPRGFSAFRVASPGSVSGPWVEPQPGGGEERCRGSDASSASLGLFLPAEGRDAVRRLRASPGRGGDGSRPLRRTPSAPTSLRVSPQFPPAASLTSGGSDTHKKGCPRRAEPTFPVACLILPLEEN